MGLVAVDYMGCAQAQTVRVVGQLPDGVVPLGRAAESESPTSGTAYIAPLRYRGDASRYGQIEVTASGAVRIWVSHATGSGAQGYYFGQVSFPIA